MKKKIALSIAAVSIAGLITGCGGGSSSSSTASSVSNTSTQPTVKSVKVVDGYVIGAKVCDANGICATTDANGTATAKFGNTVLTSTAGYIDINANHKIDDADIALPNNFTLKTPAGKSVITPITDLVANGANPAKLAEVLGINENDLFSDPIATNNVELAKAIQIVYALKVENKEAAFIEKINNFEPKEAANTDLPPMDKNITIIQPKQETNTTTPATTDLPPLKVVATDLPTFDATTTSKNSATATSASAENNTTVATSTKVKGSLTTFANLALSVAGGEAKTLITAIVNSTATNPVALEESIANIKKELLKISENEEVQTQENVAKNSETNTTQQVANQTQENVAKNSETNTTQSQITPSSVPTDLPPF